MRQIVLRAKRHSALLAASLFGLSACAVIAPANHYIGHTPMERQTKASIDALIKDGVTRKSELNAVFGYPVADNPTLAAGMHCKDDAQTCIYHLNLTDYANRRVVVKSVTVYFDKNNVVASHNYLETIRNF